MKEKSKKMHNKYNKHATSSIIRRHISICSSFSSSYIFDFKNNFRLLCSFRVLRLEVSEYCEQAHIFIPFFYGVHSSTEPKQY